MPTTDRYIKDICDLLIDSKLGYADVAHRVNEPRLRALLQQISDSRVAMIASTANINLGTARSVPHNGTFKGWLHRAWMAGRDLLSSTDDVNLIAECQRGESYLIGRYDAALRDEALPEDIRMLLARHRAELMANLTEIRLLDSALSDA